MLEYNSHCFKYKDDKVQSALKIYFVVFYLCGIISRIEFYTCQIFLFYVFLNREIWFRVELKTLKSNIIFKCFNVLITKFKLLLLKLFYELMHEVAVCSGIFSICVVEVWVSTNWGAKVSDFLLYKLKNLG